MEKLTRKTQVVTIDRANPQADVLESAAAILRQGGLVAFPTETVYGLGANAMDPAAIERIFVAKGRPADNPLIVHVADRDSLAPIVSRISPEAMRLMERFWPGPLTLVMPKSAAVPDSVTCGLATVAVRMPSHPVALALIRLSGIPLAGPSANLSGRPSSTKAVDVQEDLGGRIDMILDAGETGLGLESTVLDMTTDPPVLLRPGGVTPQEISAVIGPIVLNKSMAEAESGETPRSPGMKYAHYAPNAPVVLVCGPVLLMQSKVSEMVHEFQVEGKRVGVLCGLESRGSYLAPVVLEYGSREDLPCVAGSLFSSLRAFNRHEVDIIVAEGVSEEGIGLAIMNRLRKAAAGRVVTV